MQYILLEKLKLLSDPEQGVRQEQDQIIFWDLQEPDDSRDTSGPTFSFASMSFLQSLSSGCGWMHSP